jgi:hypothetical protein
MPALLRLLKLRLATIKAVAIRAADLHPTLQHLLKPSVTSM